MNSQLILQYPVWFVLLCLALGATYATLLYFKNNIVQNPTTSQKRIFIGLSIIRFVVVSIIAFFLLSPFLRSQFTETQKPEIIILQDITESVLNTFKAEAEQKEYLTNLKNFSDKLSSNYSVKIYPFSNKLLHPDSLAFTGKSTDIAASLQQASNLYGNQNVGAMILASDGIYNQGANPVYRLSGINYPVYTIAMGDTMPKKDLKIEKIYHNQIVYLGDKFKVAVDATSTGFDNATTTMSVTDVTDAVNPKNLYSEELTFGREELKSKEFVIEATRSGVQHFRVLLNPVNDEYTRTNNTKDFFIEVLDSRQKVLLLAAVPHPDISAFRQAIERNKNYEVVVKLLPDALNVNFSEYSVALLHQIPTATGMPQNIIDALEKPKVPLWFIVGAQTNVSQLNKYQNTLQLLTSGQRFNEVTAVTASDFQLYSLTDAFINNIQRMPPLSVPFGEYKLQPASKVLLHQRVGSVKTEYPLLAFNESLGQKTAVFAGEGFWRWRLYDYQLNQSHDFTNQLVQQAIQYLSVKEDKRPFKVKLAKNIFNENEPLIFEAELYNQSYELVNEPEVSLMLKDAEGKETALTFSRSGNGYRLVTGSLAMGNYTYTASTKLNDKSHQSSGKFTIVPLQLEALNPVANHQLLYQFSEQTNGQMFYPEQWSDLEKAITENQNIKPVLYDTFKTDSLINLKWIFFLLMGLISVEWYTRKFMGGY